MIRIGRSMRSTSTGTIFPGTSGCLYVPNAGHYLQQRLADGRQDRLRATNAVAAFARHQIHDKPMPRLQWRHGDKAGKLCLAVQCSPAPAGARLWVADAPTRDFRKAHWLQRPAKIAKGLVTGEIDPPANGYRAFFAELDFEVDGLPYHLSTQIRVSGIGINRVRQSRPGAGCGEAGAV
jgi:PhoPQ-activated pathogenicity-related protein